LSPILVRPVREQLEHDRVIRLLQAKYKRKTEVAINPGSTQTMPVGPGDAPWYPDLVLYGNDRNHRLLGVVEVETAESVNNLEAMSQWATFSRLKVPFHLYVPISYIDVARRLCADLQLTPPEIWTYQAIGEQIRFAMVQKGAIAELKYKPLPASAVKAAAKPVPPKPEPAKAVAATTVAKPPAAKAPAAVPSPAKPVAAKPSAAKPAPVKPAVAKAASVKPAAAKPAAKPVAAKPAAAKPVPAKPAAAKASPAKPAAPPARKVVAKPAKSAVKSATAKPAGKTAPAAKKAPASARPQKRR
jgi:hypothetical protein